MNIYCSGIGGIGLSAYASLQQALGHRVSGSDSGSTRLLGDFMGQGITVATVQDGSALPPDTDLFVYSEAVPSHHPERERANALGIPSFSYFQALGDLSRPSFVIAVCGTHGKSSTAAMAARVLLSTGKDPTVVVGTMVPELDGKNWRKGGGEIFLLEACEYRKSFHFLSPDLILLTTTDGDHFDYYIDVSASEEEFREFFRLLPAEGSLVVHGDDPAALRVAGSSGRRVIDADVCPLPVLSVPGRHMQENARLVLGMAQVLWIPMDAARSSLACFQGTWRRMEVKGIRDDDVLVIDDYAHHPREILVTIEALRERYPERRMVCVFQPHTHDRTRKFYRDFPQVFRGVPVVIIPYIYAVRTENDTEEVDLSAFIEDVREGSGGEVFGDFTLEETATFLNEEILHSGDILLCMGAGDITVLAEWMMMTKSPSGAAPAPR